MWSLVASAASSASGILIMLGVVAGLIGVGAFEQHKIDANSLTSLKADYAKQSAAALAKGAAIQQENDNRAIAAASAEAAVQASRVAALQQELDGVQKHVTTKAIPCISYGLVRVLDAAVLGVSPDALSLPPGKSDDTCSPITATELAVSIVSNYGAALGNAEQLAALQALLRKQGIKVR